MMAPMRSIASAARDCPLAPPSRSSTYARTLHRACVIVGGQGRLAAQLKVPDETLRAWLDGVDDPPLEVFLAAVEILLLGTENAARA